jgi:general secretion pathway protein D
VINRQTVGVIDFQGTPVQAVLEYYANNLARRSIIQAPNIAGTVYFRSQSDLTIDEARAALDSVLAINGIAVIPMGEKFLKVVQIASAKQEGLPFTGEGKTMPLGDALITQVIPLQYAEATDVVGALQPYLHAYGQLLPLPKSSCILITETAANVNQMLEIIKYIDVPSALRMETRVFQITHAKSGEVVQRLQAIIQETQQMGARASAPTTATPSQPGQPQPLIRPGTPPRPTTTGSSSDDTVIEGKVILTADERTNKIFILSRASNFAFFEKLIAELDAKVEPDVVMKVIPLDYANAEDTASIINSLISGGSPQFTTRRTTATPTTGGRTTPPSVPPPPIPVSTGAAAGDTGFLQFAEGVRILPDPRMNSILVMATKEDLARIEQMIRSVDGSVAQVLVEVIIAEVKLDNTLGVGVEIFKRQFQEGQAVMAGTSKTGIPNSPIDLSSAVASNLSQLVTSSGLTYFASFKNLRLDAVVRLLSTSSRFKVLSAPVIQTLHNQEASIVVGESRPVITSTVSDISGTVVNNQSGTAVRSNVEYKDIAIDLRVTPRINPDGYVTMDVEQKVNDVGGNVSVNGTDVPIITKREAKSSIAVRDQSTVVLGGLIREGKTVTETKTPFFGDIPFFGSLFKGKAVEKARTELIVFIQPTVLRNDEAAVAEAKRRGDVSAAGREFDLSSRFERREPVVDERQAAKLKALEEPVAEPAPVTEN